MRALGALDDATMYMLDLQFKLIQFMIIDDVIPPLAAAALYA